MTVIQHIPTGETEVTGDNLVYSAVRRIIDLLFASLGLLILSPLILLLSVFIRISGKGPVIYTQDRVGKNGKPFPIFKFRSMVFDAEKGVPLLSGDLEERITRTGRILRKYRLDEIPNLLNVLRGEMSLVGPRPERQYFIDQIIKIAPEYLQLQKVKPGVTSWGQVRYGYASSVEEMIERLPYDLYYLRRRSLWFDVRILLGTIPVVLKGKGI